MLKTPREQASRLAAARDDYVIQSRHASGEAMGDNRRASLKPWSKARRARLAANWGAR